MLPTRSKGFSLLELLIVLVILSVLYGLATVSLSAVRVSPAQQAAEQLSGLVRLLQNEAVVRSSILGISFDQEGMQIVEQTAPKQWQIVNDLRPEQAVDKAVKVQLELDGIPVILEERQLPSEIDKLFPDEESPLKPQIVILPTGEMTPFVVQWSEGKTQIRQQWDALGRQNVPDAS